MIAHDLADFDFIADRSVGHADAPSNFGSLMRS
jgi:hypothetical protein